MEATRDQINSSADTNNMAATKIRVVERSAVSPPPRTVAAISLPLTFLDIPWLPFSPGQTLFFFNFPTSTAHFMQAFLPNLKHSLSLTLQHFFPLAGRLSTPPHPTALHLEYAADDSVLLTIAEAVSGDFKNLVGYHLRMAQDFHKLVPLLQSSSKFGSEHESLLAIQITVFPHYGICIGFTLRHVVADGRTFNNFLKTWAVTSSSSLTKNDESLGFNQLLVASHDRSLIKDPNGLEEILLKGYWRSMKIPQKDSFQASLSKFHQDMTRATIVLGPKEMEMIKKWILTRSEMLFGSTQLLLSPYVITCAFVWVCWMKTHWPNSEYNQDYPKESIHYFGFIAGGITRLNYSVPNTYSGNCVGFGRSEASRDNLIMGENGVLHAAKAIGDTIKRLNSDVLGGAENWISEWEEMRDSELHVTVTGSPKLELYGVDFGWGRPIKIEEISIDKTRSISLCESREMAGGFEIGVCFPKSKLELFWTLFNKGVGSVS